jgi:hypothetical protein
LQELFAARQIEHEVLHLRAVRPARSELVVATQLEEEVLQDFPRYDGGKDHFLALSLENRLVVVPGLLRHLQHTGVFECLHLLKLVAQPQLVVKRLHLGVEVAVLVLGYMGSKLPSISKLAGQSLSEKRCVLAGW